MRSPITLLLALTFLCASCHSPATRPAAMNFPATEPAPPNSVNRLASLSPQLEDARKAYISNEREGHRSDLFSHVSWELNVVQIHHPDVVITEREVLSFLGLPDCGSTDGNETFYVYYWWRTETASRWETTIFIRGRRLAIVGSNDASVNDYSKYKQYRKWSDVPGL